MSRRIGTSFWLGSVAAFGVFLTHLLAFWLAEPDAHHRLELLEETGHSYWSFATPVAAGLLLAGLFSFTRSRLRGRALRSIAVVPTGIRLASIQAIGLLVLEVFERVSSGGTPLDVLDDRALFIGIAVQAIIAFVGALLLVGIAHAVARIRRVEGPRRSCEVDADRLPNVRCSRIGALVAAGGRGLRGPPATC